MGKNSDLYNKIMEQVAKEVKRSLNEVVVSTPVKQDVSGEVYLVRCDGMNKKTLDVLSSKLPAFDNYGSGSIRVMCKTHEEVIKVVSLLVNENVLDVDNSLNISPKISIQKVNKNSVNDSVNESRGEEIRRTYMHEYKIKSPRQKAKFNIITRINDGEIERTPDAIRDAMIETGLWDDRSEGQVQMDVNLIMRKTEPDEQVEGDFISDFVFSASNYEVGEYTTPMAAAENHIKWLRSHGLDVEVKEGRFAFKYYIHYSCKKQFDELVRWLAWHCGITDSPNTWVYGKTKENMEEAIRSGKKTIW